jgi:uncharacterized protein YfkK (UPF0435 family)
MSDLLGKLGGGLDKGLRSIRAKGKELVETTKRKSEIRDAEKSIEECFARLGRKVFEMSNQGVLANNDVLHEEIAEITSVFRRIRELNDAIREVEAEAARTCDGADTILCPGCRTPSRVGEKFCTACGGSLVPPDSTSADIRQCSSCGSTIKPGTMFCGTCGKKLV